MENGGDNFVKTNLTDEYQGNLTSYVWNYTNENSDSGLGTRSSTTGNIYGIYDFGGCLADHTSAYVWGNGTQSNTNVNLYGYAFTNGKATYLATPYITTDATNTDFTNAYPSMSKMFGDSIWEVSSALGTGNTWFGQTLETDTTTDEAFFPRGVHWPGSDLSGLCSLIDTIGDADYRYGFHVTLVVK